FEYQAAGHMIWEGMTQEGLAVTRMLHDRYHASRRNPFNEVECGDHYARSMASYGVFLAACGYRYDGPQGLLAFDPRISPDDFRAAFTTAQGWGTYRQKRTNNKQSISINLRWGSLRLRTFACGNADKYAINQIKGRIASDITDQSDQSMEYNLNPSFKVNGKECTITFDKELELQAGQSLELEIA
ncbi:MAG: glucosylceramidase, partial [Phycisphaerae bacterium]|nr:glucosylceramidase [Phycisphaerae bacterium]